MADYADRKALASKIGWEGGIYQALDYGISAEDLPADDTELVDAWRLLASAYTLFEALAAKVAALLPDDADGEDLPDAGDYYDPHAS